VPAGVPAAPAAVIILAAGEGTRMKSAKSKLLHELAGHSLLSYAVDTATEVQPEHILVVVGHLREQVEEHLADIAPHVTTVVQGEEAYGTGYAVRCAMRRLPDVAGEIVVTYADVPLLAPETVLDMISWHREDQAAITVLTARAPDPSGYGRIVRDPRGHVERIVEEADATEAEREIDEISSGIYVFDAQLLRQSLAELTPDNVKGELYLTDVLPIARGNGRVVSAYQIEDFWQTEGVNDRVQLACMNAELNRRILTGWMRDGVTILDPATTWVHKSVSMGRDVSLLPGTHLRGATSIGEGATIGPDVTLTDVEVGARATVERTQGSLSVIGADASVGPYAYLRPGTVLGARGKIGTFVEAKNAQIGEGAKVPHLTYCGDARIGEGANIGAGTIFANYDGLTKSPSTVGRHSFIGSNTVLVAPVNVADGAYVAAGSTITADVEPGQLAVARSQQRNINGWVARKRPGSKTAAAAETAAGPAMAAAGGAGEQA
jgi:bifunctional UDP-N-acetylglucosamine pyrophosphorylase / glucosamine-1-phosphate N-acetyltransferase